MCWDFLEESSLFQYNTFISARNLTSIRVAGLLRHRCQNLGIGNSRGFETWIKIWLSILITWSSWMLSVFVHLLVGSVARSSQCPTGVLERVYHPRPVCVNTRLGELNTNSVSTIAIGLTTASQRKIYQLLTLSAKHCYSCLARYSSSYLQKETVNTLKLLNVSAQNGHYI